MRRVKMDSETRTYLLQLPQRQNLVCSFTTPAGNYSDPTIHCTWTVTTELVRLIFLLKSATYIIHH